MEVAEEEDPVKRTIVRVPKVVKRRGKLRWIGDLVTSGVGKVADTLGLNPNSFRRRQGGPPPGVAAQAMGFMLKTIENIPLQQVYQ